MGQIKVLDTYTADKIAAGEVIERPLSVVKELLENSIDAQATYIEIEIKDGGIGLIKVRDDGVGMNYEDLVLAFERHATSKIADFNDLFHLNTFGFRGEALPSIAAVAQVEMTSSARGETTANQIKLTHGLPPEIHSLGGANGTTLVVKNLFYNIPARRKFLKSPAYEAGLIGEVVAKYALGHPNIRFKLIVNGQINLDTAGLNTVEQRMIHLYGNDLTNQMIPIEQQAILPNHFVQAWLVKEDITRANRNQETFFVNGRLIKSQELSRALEEGYYTLLPKGRFPIAVVHLTLPGQQLDVNIHPAKLEIKIHEMDRLRDKLIQLFKDSLWDANITKNAFLIGSFDHESKPDYERNKAHTTKSTAVVAPTKEQTQEKSMVEQPTQQQTLGFTKVEPLADAVKETTLPFEQKIKATSPPSEQKSMKVIEEAVKKPPLSAEKPLLDWQQSQSTEKKVAKIKDVNEMVLLGQLNQSFIIAQNKEGLFIIDQHTCHERILYERFMQEEVDKPTTVEYLLIPTTVNLSPQQDGVLVEHILTLTQLGFVLENFGERSYLIRGLPLGLGQVDNPGEMFIDLIDDFAKDKHITTAVIKEKLLITASCKGAVKARSKLTDIEMLTLLHDLAKTENAHTCPHGRPIIYKLSMEELYRIFKRGAYTYE